MVTVVLTAFSVASEQMYYSIMMSIKIGLICDESAWIRLISRTHRDLSPSIALKRKLFGGRSDGKFGLPSVELSLFQQLRSAGDN